MALDLIVLGILLFSSLVAFFRGFIKEVLTIVGLVGAAVAAVWFAPAFSGVTSAWFPAEGKAFDLVPWRYVGLATAYGIIFVVVLVSLTIISHWLSTLVRAAGLGPVDRSFGVVFGLLRGVVLVGLLFLPFHMILSAEQKQQYFGQAKTLGYVTYVSELMQALLPSQEQILGKKAGEQKPEDSAPAAPAANTLADPLKGLTGETPAPQPKAAP